MPIISLEVVDYRDSESMTQSPSQVAPGTGCASNPVSTECFSGNAGMSSPCLPRDFRLSFLLPVCRSLLPLSTHTGGDAHTILIPGSRPLKKDSRQQDCLSPQLLSRRARSAQSYLRRKQGFSTAYLVEHDRDDLSGNLLAPVINTRTDLRGHDSFSPSIDHASISTGSGNRPSGPAFGVRPTSVMCIIEYRVII